MSTNRSVKVCTVGPAACMDDYLFHTRNITLCHTYPQRVLFRAAIPLYDCCQWTYPVIIWPKTFVHCAVKCVFLSSNSSFFPSTSSTPIVRAASSSLRDASSVVTQTRHRDTALECSSRVYNAITCHRTLYGRYFYGSNPDACHREKRKRANKIK